MGQQRSAEHRDFSALAPELSQSLLAWWEVHGRKDPALKPWMFTKDGRWPEPDRGSRGEVQHVQGGADGGDNGGERGDGHGRRDHRSAEPGSEYVRAG